MTIASGDSRNDRLRKGIAWGAVLSCLGVASIFLSTISAIFPLAALVVAPLAVGMTILREELVGRLMFAAVLVLTLELLLGGAGNWVSISGVPIRYLILLASLAVGALYVFKERELRLPKMGVFVVAFYGVVLPLAWFAFSAFRGNNLGLALGDISFLMGLVAYFPLALAFKRQATALVGFLFGVFLVLSLSLLASPLVVEAYVSWFSGNVSFFPNEFPRVSLNARVLLLVGMVWGILYFADPAQARLHRVLGLIMLAGATVSLSLSFTRGTLGSAVLVLVLTLVAGALIPRTRPLRWRAIGTVMVMAPVIFVLMFSLSPGGASRFFNLPGETVALIETISDGSDSAERPQGGAEEPANAEPDDAPETVAGSIRSRQSEALIDEWEDDPLFGEGVGAVPEDYVRSEGNPTLLELEYHALLYKVGAVGLGLFGLLLAFLGVRYVSLLRWRSKLLGTHEGKAATSLLAATLGIALVGVTNPVLTSAYFSFLVALYLASEVSLDTRGEDKNIGGEAR